MIEWVLRDRLARGARPGAGGATDAAAVGAWLEEARAMGIRSILCLLDDEQLAAYDDLPGGLLEGYRRSGFTVGHLPVRDHQDPPIPPDALPRLWSFFNDLPSPLLVHCWAGVDRTGAAVQYLVRRIAREGES